MRGWLVFAFVMKIIKISWVQFAVLTLWTNDKDQQSKKERINGASSGK